MTEVYIKSMLFFDTPIARSIDRDSEQLPIQLGGAVQQQWERSVNDV